MRRSLLSYSIAVLSVFIGLQTNASGGHAPGNPEETLVTWIDDIQPLVQKKCAMCHNANSTLPNWTDYLTAKRKCKAIYDHVVVLKNMPIGIPMAQKERDLFEQWIELGAPYSEDTYVEGETCGSDEDHNGGHGGGHKGGESH